ncbi:MAG: type VI secretion system tip protein VgrG, partial [Nannocystaceae bacterium]|nr:type VI secretion system tip protein VgrG [Nannocystaceae bacterium]
FAGGLFTLDGHPGKTLDRTYLLTHVTHRADCPEADLRAGGSVAGVNYGNRIEAIDAEVAYRPARRKKPQAYGHQTATVVGPPGEEIHTDALGRIQVWMHWDRSGAEAPLDNTCWLRVAQPLAGPGFGTMFLPRVGMQVLVSFVDGDPDRPVCVGCLYDGANAPPYALPEERTKTTIKTRSTPGGDGFNELRFEDAKGSEQVYLHAQRNLDEQVGSAHSTNVGASQSLSVGTDQTTKVGADRNITVQGNQSVRIESQPKGGGVPGTGLSTFVVGNIETESKMGYTLTAPNEIRLVCGETKIEMTPVGITLTAAGGAVLKLDAAVMLTAAGKAAQLAIAQDGKAALSSSLLKGKLSVDSVVKLSSMAGATAVLDDKVTTTAAGGAKLELSADATLSGANSSIESSGARVALDADVDVYGSEVRVHSINGSVKADAFGVKVSGTDVKVIGNAIVTVVAPIVKVN